MSKKTPVRAFEACLSVLGRLSLFGALAGVLPLGAGHALAAPEPAAVGAAEAAGPLERAYFASGCFWCVEAIFESLQGVEEAVSGYAGGHTENPTYEQTNTGRTGHAETVEVRYDPEQIEFPALVEVFFGSHDPTQANGQGPDIGSQYRSIAFYRNEREKRVIEQAIERLNRTRYDGSIVTEVRELDAFWKAEPYHQNFKARHPNHPYIRAVSKPRLERFKAHFSELLKPGARGEG